MSSCLVTVKTDGGVCPCMDTSCRNVKHITDIRYKSWDSNKTPHSSDFGMVTCLSGETLDVAITSVVGTVESWYKTLRYTTTA